jgi:hypothetical protein
MYENICGNCGWARVDICMTFHIRAFDFFCAIILYLLIYHVCFQDGKLCLLVANDKLDGK